MARSADRAEQPPPRHGSPHGSAPVEDAGPAPTRAGCRETRVGRRVLCIKAAVTSRGARDRGSKGRGLEPGAGPEEEEAQPGNPSHGGGPR